MQETQKYVGKFLEDDYKKFSETFMSLFKDYKKKTQRLDKIIKQSDNQQFRLIKLNDELEEYKKKLEDRIEVDKIVFQKTREMQMGEIISMIAHQWRQPLSSINGTLLSIQLKQMISDIDYSDEKQVKEIFKEQNQMIDKVTHEVELLSETINKFKDFFKPSKEKENIYIKNIIQNIYTIAKEEFEEHNISLIVDIDFDYKIFVHQNEILQIFLNILKNSKESFLKSNIENKNIVLKTQKLNNKLLVSVIDNAGGVDEDILPKIFDPYFSTKEEKNGRGIGLYMAKMIVEEHNGGNLRAYNTQNGLCLEISWEL